MLSTLRVVAATTADIPGWLELAAEVEELFGPLVHDAQFRRALQVNLERGQSWCVRERNGGPGEPLAGAGIFDTREAPNYEISWLAVAERWRRHGVARLLIQHFLSLATPPAEVRVTTFGATVSGGEAARLLYRSLGFREGSSVAGGPRQGSRVVLCRVLR